jgi:two-component system, NarL family, response regulator DegU
MLPIKVLLADDSHPVRRQIRRLLEEDPDIEVLAEANNYLQIVELCDALKPHVVLMDLHMRDRVATLADVKPYLSGCDAKVLAMSFANDEGAKALAYDVGALMLLDKTTLHDDLIPAIKRLVSGSEATL